MSRVMSKGFSVPKNVINQLRIRFAELIHYLDMANAHILAASDLDFAQLRGFGPPLVDKHGVLWPSGTKLPQRRTQRTKHSSTVFAKYGFKLFEIFFRIFGREVAGGRADVLGGFCGSTRTSCCAVTNEVGSVKISEATKTKPTCPFIGSLRKLVQKLGFFR